MKFDFLLDVFMNAWNFWLNMNFENACLNVWNLMFCSFFFEWCIYECMKFLIKSEFWIWMKNVWIHKIWFFFVLLEECIYECMKVWLNMNFWFEWKCLNAWNLIFYSFWRVYLWMLECMNSFCLFDFFCFIIFEKCIYECMKFYFLLFCYFKRMHIWMHDIWFYFEECMLKCMKFCVFIIFYFKWKCMFESLIFYFWFSWMIMHILNEWNSIFHFLFSWMIMHEILFSWIIIFDANVCIIFFRWFYKWWFFLSELFNDNVSKRYVLIFQKRRYVQKIFSMIFKCFKMYVQRFSEIYILCTFKRIFQWFFLV